MTDIGVTEPFIAAKEEATVSVMSAAASMTETGTNTVPIRNKYGLIVENKLFRTERQNLNCDLCILAVGIYCTTRAATIQVNFW